MKKKSLLLLPLSVLALASCGKTVNIKDDQNYDVDPISSITDDGGVNDFDSMSVEEENVEVPSEYDSFSDNTITDEGKYYLKGEYPKISITVAKNKVVYVFLDGVTISSSEGIAFGSDNKITLYVVLLNNSVNSISNDFLDTNAFHVKGDVHIQGSGTLNVTSAQKNGLKASKDLYITGSGVSLNVTGANHAISARSIIVNDATISVNAQKDGIQLECDSDVTEYTNTQGYAYLVNAKVTSVTHGDGIQANSFVYISGGTYNLTTYGEFVPYSSENMTTYELETDDFKYVKSGSIYKRVATDEIRSLSSSYYALANSVKGIKVSEIEYNSAPITTGDYSIYVAHLANITINSPDDCIHTNYGDTTIDSSNLTLDTYDDGVHADYDLVINNSSVVVNSSYEGLEGATVTINGANTNIVTNSGDDGINAASDLSSNNVITINDGYLRVYASGDGLDANTALYLKGGVVIVEGPGSGNGSLDAEKIYFQGGIVFACSTSGMRESMSATQNTFLYQGSTIASGSKISIVDSSDNALFSYTLKQSCNQIIFSHKDLVLKSTYRIVNGSTEVASITMSSSLTTVGSSSGGPGGGGPGGGGG